MSSQRAVQRSFQRLAINSPSRRIFALSRFPSPATVAANGISMQKRYTTTTDAKTVSIPEDAARRDILIEQRTRRPVSPHLGIYQPQVTWTLSALNRITGSLLSGGLYLFSVAYLAAPALGWHLESAVLAASFATWPVAAKFATKLLVSMPFTFHCFNGIRHMVWDFAKQLKNDQVIRTGWAVVAATVLSSVGLALM